MVSHGLLGKLGTSGRLLIVLAFALMLYFAYTNIAHTQTPHVVNAHAYQLACGGYLGPPCGNVLSPVK